MVAEMTATEARPAPTFTRVRLVDEITRHLREMIVSGELPAGTQLLQTQLAEQLGVSRTPLREAFRVLENDGIIRTSSGNRTAEVVTIGTDQLKEMYEVREVIDGLAARLATQKGLSRETERELRRLLRRMKASISPFDPAERIDAHAAFHSLIVESSGNASLLTFLPLIRVSSAALYMPFIEDPSVVTQKKGGRRVTVRETMEHAQLGHEAIVEAILSGDARKAEAAARRHIVSTLAEVDKLDDWRRAITEAREAAKPAAGTIA
jgi:GntR family transcriptional regulator, vanillate catabolism transcriptional regulator